MLNKHPPPFDVLVMKLPDGGFRSLYLQCTHRDQAVTATPTGLYCPSHGSRFALDGSVQEGPATRPLISLPTLAKEDHVVVYLKR